MAQIFRDWQAAYAERGLPHQPDTPRSLAAMREHDGRNDGLFDIVRRNGHRLPANLEAFTDFARKQNAMCPKLMDDDEVVAVATSVLKNRMNGTLGSGGGVVTIDHADIDSLMTENPDAYLLYSFLRRHHWGRDFTLANETASQMPSGGWRRPTLCGGRSGTDRRRVSDGRRPASHLAATTHDLPPFAAREGKKRRGGVLVSIWWAKMGTLKIRVFATLATVPRSPSWRTAARAGISITNTPTRRSHRLALLDQTEPAQQSRSS